MGPRWARAVPPLPPLWPGRHMGGFNPKLRERARLSAPAQPARLLHQRALQTLSSSSGVSKRTERAPAGSTWASRCQILIGERGNGGPDRPPGRRNLPEQKINIEAQSGLDFRGLERPCTAVTGGGGCLSRHVWGYYCFIPGVLPRITLSPGPGVP